MVDKKPNSVLKTLHCHLVGRILKDLENTIGN